MVIHSEEKTDFVPSYIHRRVNLISKLHRLHKIRAIDFIIERQPTNLYCLSVLFFLFRQTDYILTWPQNEPSSSRRASYSIITKKYIYMYIYIHFLWNPFPWLNLFICFLFSTRNNNLSSTIICILNKISTSFV